MVEEFTNLLDKCHADHSYQFHQYSSMNVKLYFKKKFDFLVPMRVSEYSSHEKFVYCLQTELTIVIRNVESRLPALEIHFGKIDTAKSERPKYLRNRLWKWIKKTFRNGIVRIGRA